MANVTATSPELLAELRARAEHGPTRFTLVVPAAPVAGGRERAQEALGQALELMGAAGLQAAGHVGDSDPICAVSDEWDPRSYDEIVLATLPAGVSKWLHGGLPERVERLTGARVTHVVARPAKPEVAVHPAPARERLGVMAPLSVLSWGARRAR
ncbi:MAG TPA: hypothetical protein VF781_15570 [Solirubrobacteraceae bacterium]